MPAQQILPEPQKFPWINHLFWCWQQCTHIYCNKGQNTGLKSKSMVITCHPSKETFWLHQWDVLDIIYRHRPSHERNEPLEVHCIQGPWSSPCRDWSRLLTLRWPNVQLHSGRTFMVHQSLPITLISHGNSRSEEKDSFGSYSPSRSSTAIYMVAMSLVPTLSYVSLSSEFSA